MSDLLDRVWYEPRADKETGDIIADALSIAEDMIESASVYVPLTRGSGWWITKIGSDAKLKRAREVWSAIRADAAPVTPAAEREAQP